MEFRILKYSWIFILVFILSGCTKEVHVDIPGFSEKVVIEGTIETDGMPMVLISKNKDVYAPTSQAEVLGSYLSGAEVWVSDGTTTIQLTEICTNNLPAGMDTVVANYLGVPPELISQVGICAYIGLDPNFKGEVGKTYTLKVNFEGKTYEASSTITDPISLHDPYWKEETAADMQGYGMIYYRINDPAPIGNAYKLEVRRMNLNEHGEPIDSRYSKPFSAYFDDEFFNGEDIEMNTDNPMTYNDTLMDRKYRGYFQKGDTVSLKLSTYEHSIYRFLYSITFQQMMGSSPFSTPTNPEGNIPGALGAWIAFSPTYLEMICE